MNKFISRLMLASATIALGTALTPIAANAFDTVNNNTTDPHFGNLILGDAEGASDTYKVTGSVGVTTVKFEDPKPAGVPNGALIVGNAGFGSFTQGAFGVPTAPYPLVQVAGDLAIGVQPTGEGHYTLNYGELTVDGQLSVGGQSKAANSFDQFAGAVILTGSAAHYGTDDEGNPTPNPLYESVPVGSLAYSAKLTVGGGLNDNGGNTGGTGTYNLHGGTINALANGIEVGATGLGIMNQSGGSVTTTFFTVGDFGDGTYTLSGGTINAFREAVGNAGAGVFNQSSGAHTIGLNGDGSLQDTSTAALTIGAHCCDNTLGSGIYTMTGGELHTGNMVVGDGEHGTFIQLTPVVEDDPLVEVTGNLVVGGAQDGSVGSYSITGNDSFLNVKFAPGGNGNDGTNGTYKVTTHDDDTNTDTTVDVSRPNPNGALIIAQGLADGSATVSGTFTQDVDSHVNVAGDVVLGQNRGATGTYTLSSGDLKIGGKLLVGDSGIGSFNQSGGDVTLTGSATVSPDYSAIGNASFNHQYDGVSIAWIGGSWGSGSPTGTYTMTGGSLHAGGIELGFTGTGEMDQSSGVVTAQFMNLGGCGGCNGGNSVGIYRLSGDGELNVTNSGEAVGQFGHGEFYQTDGTHNVTGGLRIGDAPSLYADHNGIPYGEPGYTPNPSDSVQPDRSGYYELSGGVLSTDTTVVGSSGLGRFLQNGGEHDIAGNLIIGRDFMPIERGCGDPGATTCSVGGPAHGTYTMTDGTATVGGNAIVGEHGIGKLDISGSSQFSADGAIVIANSLGSGGSSMSISGSGASGAVVSSTYLYVGGGDEGSLTLNNGGHLTVSGQTFVGGSPDGVGHVTQNGGSFETAFLDIGFSALNGGSYAMHGGTLTVDANLVLGSVFVAGSSGSFTQNGGTVHTGDLYINNTSVYGISAGTLTAAGTIFVGDNAGANAQFNQSGGTVTAGHLIVGNLQGIGGTYNLTGGTLNDDAIVGDAGTGNFNNTNATHNVTGNLTLGNQATGNGTYNLTAGGTTTVTGDTIVGNSGTGTFTNDASTHDTHILRLASESGSSGSYSLGNGAALNVGTSGNTGFADIGQHGIGTLVQNGLTSSTTIYGALDVGRFVGGTGQVDLNGGSMTVNGFAVVGDSGTGTFNQGGNTTMDVVGGGLGIGRGQSNENSNPITGTGTYNLAGAAGLTVTGGIGLGQSAGNTGTMNQTGGTVVADSETVGQGGTGFWNQSGSSSNTVSGNLVVGDSPGGTGTYNLGDTAGLTVGSSAPGETGGSIVLGNAGSNGTFNLSGSGSVTVTAGSDAQSGTIFVGTAGTGSFTQSGTSTVSATNLSLGNNAGGVGTYTLTGGTVTLINLYVGGEGHGTFTQSGASSVATGYLSVGNNAGGVGNYNLSAGSLTNFGDTFLGGDTLAQGTITQTGGTAALDGDVNVGYAAGATGTYTLGGSGAATIGGNLDIGVEGTGTVNFNTAGGGAATLAFTTPTSTLTVGDAGTGTFNQGGGDLNLTAAGVALKIGALAGSHGTYNLSGGSLEDDLIVGDAGTGSFNNNGGSHSVTGDLILGNQSGGSGTYSLSGAGSLTVSGASRIGNNGVGTYLQSGGTAIVTDAMILGSGGTGSGSGAVSGGTLTLNSLTIDNANTTTASSFTVNGGAVDVHFGVIVNNSGTVNGSSLTVSSGSLGAKSMANNDLLNITGGTVTTTLVTNNHQFNFLGGEVVGTVNNNATLDSNGGGTATITGALINNNTGTVKISNNSTLKVDGNVAEDVRNAGTVTVESGSKLDASGHNYIQQSGTTTVDGQIAANMAQIILGTLQGTGTVTGNVSNEGGKVRGGDNGAPGALAVTGTYDQQITAAFETTIAGLGPTQVGKLNVGGVATLSGALQVITDNFTFAAGELFNIMNFAGSIGDFTSFSLNGSACTSIGVDSYSCAGLASGLYFQEQFANGDHALNLFIAQMDVEPPTDVPEPMTIGLFIAGIGGVTVIRRRRKVQKAA